jgi:hypothetical protein
MALIKILYKCQCLTEEVAFYVRPRHEREYLGAYMEGVVSQALAEDHHLRSPFCRAAKTEYVTIELKDGASGIGMAPPLKPRGTNENPP